MTDMGFIVGILPQGKLLLWDGDHPRFEYARQLWGSCSLLMSLPIFLIRFFP
jgi:hypothetical protein